MSVLASFWRGVLPEVVRRFNASETGSIAVIFALSAILLIGAMGLAVDVAGAYRLRTMLQSAADSAALSGVKKLKDGGSANQALQVSANYLNAGLLAGITFSQTVTVANTNEQETVALSSVYPSVVHQLLHGGPMNVGVTATAIIGEADGPPVCIHALDPTMSKAVEASGGSSINAPGCRVWVNSNSSKSVNLSGGSTLEAEKACLHGGVDQGVVTPTPEDCGVRDDPFSTMNPSTSATCNNNNFTKGGGTYSLTPGVYCGGLTLSGGPTVTLQPGTYVIRNGKLSMSGGGSMTGNGVTFVFEGTAVMDLSGGGSYHLTAPTSGDFKSFVFFQRPTANPGKTAKMTGGGNMYFEGVIYLPTWKAEVSGTGSVGTPSPWSAYIAKSLLFSGGSSININYDPSRITVPIPDALVVGDRPIYLIH